jgi:hypothetical protein
VTGKKWTQLIFIMTSRSRWIIDYPFEMPRNLAIAASGAPTLTICSAVCNAPAASQGSQMGASSGPAGLAESSLLALELLLSFNFDFKRCSLSTMRKRELALELLHVRCALASLD